MHEATEVMIRRIKVMMRRTKSPSRDLGNSVIISERLKNLFWS